jgi:hypothetical protein
MTVTNDPQYYGQPESFEEYVHNESRGIAAILTVLKRDAVAEFGYDDALEVCRGWIETLRSAGVRHEVILEALELLVQISKPRPF